MMRIEIAIFASLSFCAMQLLAEPPEKKTRIVDIEGLVIEGEIQRPEAFFILQRDQQNLLSTLTLDPLGDAEQKIEEWAHSEIFK